MFKPVKEVKQHLYENIVLQIKAVILGGSLKPGDKLPSEREMADIFGVSRSSIREATKTLATLGLIRVVHGQGVFVAQRNNEETFSQMIDQIADVGQGSMRDLFELRRLVEPQSAAWAAERRTKQEAAAIVRAVQAIYSELVPAEPNLMRLWDHDTKFHISVAMASHNEVLVRTLRSILDLMAESRKKTLLIKERPPKSVSEHLAVAQAIAEGDPEAARQAMYEHLDNVSKDMAYL